MKWYFTCSLLIDFSPYPLLSAPANIFLFLRPFIFLRQLSIVSPKITQGFRHIVQFVITKEANIYSLRNQQNLGLGVLEERKRQEQLQSGIRLPNHHHEDEDGSCDGDDDESSERSGGSSAATEKLLPKSGKSEMKKKGKREGEEDDVLGRLMGRSRSTKKGKPNIEVL